MTNSDQSGAQEPADVQGHVRVSADPRLDEDDVEGHCNWRVVDPQLGEEDVEGPRGSR